tara:strand:+ start:78 stop:653 length:576 start_codon:yes stop_codon:yes gene_type:complete
MKSKKNRYILIPKDLQKNLIEFLDEVQLEAAKLNNNTDMHIVNFCSYAIQELLNGLDAQFKTKSKPQPKSRDQYLDETFMDWNLPEMDDEEYNKLVDQVDSFLRGWEKEYKKKHPNEPVQKKPYKPEVDDVMEYCSLDEIKDFLKDDPELSDEERFELYYDEREKRRERKNSLSYEQLLKKSGVLPPSTKK